MSAPADITGTIIGFSNGGASSLPVSGPLFDPTVAVATDGGAGSVDTSTIQSTCVDPIFGTPVDCSTLSTATNTCVDQITGLPVDCSTQLPLSTSNTPAFALCPTGYVCDSSGNIMGVATTGGSSMPCFAGPVGPLAPGQVYCATGTANPPPQAGGTTLSTGGTPGGGTSGVGSIATGLGNLIGGIIHAVTGTGGTAAPASSGARAPGTGTATQSGLGATLGGSTGLLLVVGLVILFALMKHKGGRVHHG